MLLVFEFCFYWQIVHIYNYISIFDEIKIIIIIPVSIVSINPSMRIIFVLKFQLLSKIKTLYAYLCKLKIRLPICSITLT